MNSILTCIVGEVQKYRTSHIEIEIQSGFFATTYIRFLFKRLVDKISEKYKPLLENVPARTVNKLQMRDIQYKENSIRVNQRLRY